MWYIIVPVCVSAMAILLLSFGIWGIIYWDQYSKLLANINLIIKKFAYNIIWKGKDDEHGL